MALDASGVPVHALISRADAPTALLAAVADEGQGRSEDTRLALLLECGDRLANVVENSVPARYRAQASLRNALRQWDEASEAVAFGEVDD